MTTKAKRAEVQWANRTIEGAMLPNGEYCMSQSQAAEMVGRTKRNASEFLKGKAIKSLLGKGYTGTKNLIELESTGQSRGGTRIDALSLNEVSAYWLWQTYRGNKQALALCMSLITESLERRFDVAFGVERSESERNQRLQSQIDEMWRVLEDLGESWAMDDEVRRERDYFGELLRQNGIDPYKLPETEN